MKQLVEHLHTRGLENLPQNTRHVLVQLVAASCSQRTFVSLQECAYRICNLPLVMKSFPNVEVVGCYHRALLTSTRYRPDEILYTDRTKYSAYAERCQPTTKIVGYSKEDIEAMSLRDFAERVNCTFQKRKDLESDELDQTSHKKFRCLKVGSGHWNLHKRKKRGHVRFSTVLNTALAIDYEPVDVDVTTTQSTFMQLPVDKRRQLARSNYELVVYHPWKDDPDKTFLTKDTRNQLAVSDLEAGQRFSLMR